METLTNYPLAALTSFKIGGPAERFAAPRNLVELQTLFKIEPGNKTIIGRASNLLIRDRGLRGLVVYLGNMQSPIVIDQQTGIVEISAGTSLTFLVDQCLQRGLDATFLTGIPGSVGGALKMNAGAHGDEIWQHVHEVQIIDPQGAIMPCPIHQFTPIYRGLHGLPPNSYFTSAVLRFEKNSTEQLIDKYRNYLTKRKQTQPLTLPSAGSIFKNPPQKYAAQLIEAVGLKGFRLGGAIISDKHANFIVNADRATAQEVEDLITIIIDKVKTTFGILLDLEVKILGDA